MCHFYCCTKIPLYFVLPFFCLNLAFVFFLFSLFLVHPLIDTEVKFEEKNIHIRQAFDVSSLTFIAISFNIASLFMLFTVDGELF